MDIGHQQSVYRPLAEGEIRVLRVGYPNGQDQPVGTLKTLLLSDSKACEHYTAIAYSHGLDLSHHSLAIGNAQVSLDANTWALLAAMRKPGRLARTYHSSTWWWINQMCIHHDDPDEVAHLARVLCDIYRLAHSTVVWLGVTSNDSDLAIELIDDLGGVDKSDSWAAETIVRETPVAAFDGLISLFQDREWWTQAWTQLEEIVTIDNEYTLICGDSTTSSKALHRAVWWISTEFLPVRHYQTLRHTAGWKVVVKRLGASTDENADDAGLLKSSGDDFSAPCDDNETDAGSASELLTRAQNK